MLSSIKLQLAIPALGDYELATGAIDAALKGSSMNSAAYIVTPTQLTAITGGLAQGQLMHTLQRRAPGQKGSNRSQTLFQIVALDVNGRPYITSANLTLTEPNYFVAPAGVEYSQIKVSEACVGGVIGYALNASGASTGNHQADWTEASNSGLIL